LQQVAFVVTVDQNAQFPEWLEVFSISPTRSRIVS
jgi:hypothetical protein